MMNPIYTIMESQHRWSILAAIAFGAGCLGAMMMLAYAWPHPLALIWLLAGVAACAYCLIRALLQWREGVELAAKRAGVWDEESG